jgi:hypothetical protein
MIPFVSLNAATTGTGLAMPANENEQIGWYIEFSAGVTDGAAVVEAAASKDYPGLWHQLSSVSRADLASVPAVFFGTYPGAPVMFTRVRITTEIQGGTVTGRLVKRAIH